ncbi:MAG TPA: hypothetical protein VF662_01000 [Allosphingosinicella sp.]|jgi:hypothetical protein
MFERTLARIRVNADLRAAARIQALAERMEPALPRGVRAEPAPEGVLLSGRALRRRFALEPALRWLTAVLR